MPYLTKCHLILHQCAFGCSRSPNPLSRMERSPLQSNAVPGALHKATCAPRLFAGSHVHHFSHGAYIARPKQNLNDLSDPFVNPPVPFLKYLPSLLLHPPSAKKPLPCPFLQSLPPSLAAIHVPGGSYEQRNLAARTSPPREKVFVEHSGPEISNRTALKCAPCPRGSNFSCTAHQAGMRLMTACRREYHIVVLGAGRLPDNVSLYLSGLRGDCRRRWEELSHRSVDSVPGAPGRTLIPSNSSICTKCMDRKL